MSRPRVHRAQELFIAVLLLLLPVGLPCAAAQSAANTSGIEGKVTDESGAVLPGVTVTISSPALQSPQLETTTNESGRYRFSDLPAGKYDVTCMLPGFQSVTIKELQVAANFIATRDVRMGVGQVEETITVAGASPVVDVRTTASVTSIRADVIEAIPTSRSYEEMAKLAPGVRVSGVPDVGGNKTGGGRGTLVNYGSSAGGSTLMLDGINTDGTAGYYDMGAIEEMIVRAAGSDPEIATPGMAFQAIVKSGGNDFHGEGLAAIQTRGLQSNNIDDELRQKGVTGGNPMDRYYDLNASIGGRVLRDRLWFFGSTRRKEDRAEIISFSGGPGPDNIYFTPDDEGGLTADRESNLVGKITAKLSRNQNLSWMHHYNYKKQDNRGGSAFIPHEAAGDYELPNSVYRFDNTNTLTSRSFFRVTAGRSWWESNAVPYTDNPPSFDQATQRRLGAYYNSIGSDSTPAGSLASRYQYHAAYSYFLPSRFGGDHDLKVGASYNSEVYNKFQKARGQGTGGVGNDYLLTFNNGNPVEVLLYNSPFDSKNTVHYVGGYVRDSWRIGERLTANLGVRFERYNAFLPAQSKPAGPYSDAADYPETDLYNWSGIAPRAGLSYALTSDNKTAIKVAYGRFNFALRASDSRTVRNFNKNDYSATRYRWNDVNGNKRLDYPQELGAFVAREGGSTTVFNEDIQQPMTEEFTFHLQREITGGVAARFGYVFKRENDLFQLVNTARPYEATTGRSRPRIRVPTGWWATAMTAGRSPTTTSMRPTAARPSKSSRTSTSPATTTSTTTSSSESRSACRTAGSSRGRCWRPSATSGWWACR